jgi:NAD(P)-dependent dehydrogenase (short-subunit alcohol dehydrogenase family)
VFGDIQAEASEKQAQKLSTFPVKFVRTDVTKYEDLLALFDTALKNDCAISNAGVVEVGNWVDPNLDLEGIQKVYPAHLLYKRTTN